MTRQSFAGAVVVGLLAVSLLPGTALGATLAARASLAPMRQFVGDSAGQNFQLTVRNTGSGQRIGAFEIVRPSAYWTVIGCALGPAGWVQVVSADSCRFMSAAGTADDIKPGQRRMVTMLATTPAGDTDLKGTWTVNVSGGDDFSQPTLISQATPMDFGLTTHVFSFQIMDAVVADSPATVGDPCPASNKDAEPGSTGHTVVLCGRNRTTTTRTLLPKFAGLKGTFIRNHGAFSSGPVAPTADSVVLGNWADVSITNLTGDDFTVMARVRSAPLRTSPWRTLDDYRSVDIEHATVANTDAYSTNEDTMLTVLVPGVVGNDSDQDPGALHSLKITDPSNGSLTMNSDGSFQYTPDPSYHGTDSFTYQAGQAAPDSNIATVNITVNPMNDAPVAVGDSVATVTTTPINIPAPGVLDNDADVDSASLTAVLVSGPVSASSFVLNADGSFSYTANAGFTGGDSFTYKANDGSLDSNIVTVSITVNSSGGPGGGGGCLISC